MLSLSLFDRKVCHLRWRMSCFFFLFFIPSPRSCVLKIPRHPNSFSLLVSKSEALFSDLVFFLFNSIRSCVLILYFVFFLPVTAFLCSGFGLCRFLEIFLCIFCFFGAKYSVIHSLLYFILFYFILKFKKKKLKKKKI